MSGAHRSASDRAGGPADLSRKGVSAKGAHPLRGEAFALCEQFIGQVLLAREFEETLPGSAAWQRLKHSPVRQIDGVGGLPASEYAVDIDSSGDGWVRVTKDAAAEAVTVRYWAGMATGVEHLPAPLVAGIERLTAHLANNPTGEPPAAVTALWRPYRRIRL